MKRVLVVEDDLLVRITVCHYLQCMGWEAAEARTGLAALEVLKSRALRIDAVVADLGLPDMNGADLVSQAHVGCPFVFMSGALQPPTSLPGPVLLKPFGEEVLSATLNTLLSAGDRRACI